MSPPTPKFRTFAFTLRPRTGVTDSQVESLCAYCKKRCQWYKIITEKKDDDRHVHAVWVLKAPATRSQVLTYLLRMYPDLDSEERSVMRQGLKIWYNRDFLDYMDKEDDTVVIEENLPEMYFLDSVFPPPPVSRGSQKKLFMHAKMEEYERLWHQHMPVSTVVNTENARNFLVKMQFEERVIGLLTDQQVIQHSKWLVRWMVKANTYTPTLPVFEQEEGVDVHPLNRH